MESSTNKTIEDVKEYYGKVLQTTDDLKTSACCTAQAPPTHLRSILSKIHPEILDRFYGCGSPIPPALEGCTVLDLGCGTGRDCYLMSALVGPSGHVIGVDMTDEQLAVAEKHRDYHAEAFGLPHSNVTFKKGFIEDLAGAGIESNSVDVVVSNCVLNLSADKGRVFKELMRVLKPGGELFFSDVFADRRIPRDLAADPVLLGECLGGALYTEDFRRILADLGVHDYRVVASDPIEIQDEAVFRKIGMIRFQSLTIRAFKLDLEDRCEDYGQIAWYKGTLPQHPHSFELDDHHNLETGRPFPVCGNTADMLSKTRFATHFDFHGDKSQHFGLFDCEPAPSASGEDNSAACC